jgi:hypothetical protein
MPQYSNINIEEEDRENNPGQQTLGLAAQGQKKPQMFNFDRVYPGNASQEEIFEFAGKPIVDIFLQVCLNRLLV